MILGILVVLAISVGAFFVLSGDDKGEEIVLEPVGMVQEDDFAGNLDVGERPASWRPRTSVLSPTPPPRTSARPSPVA